MEQEALIPTKRLLKQVTWQHKDTELHAAARAGNLERVRGILSGRSLDSPEACDREGEVIMEIADGKAQRDLIAAQNDLGETALYVAAGCGHLEVVKELVNYVDLEAASLKTRSGFDALHIAAKHGHLDIVVELLRCCPSLSMTTDLSNSTPLYSAAIQGHLTVVNALLEADVKLIKIARSNGKTALHSVARLGHLEVMKVLLNKDPELATRKDNKGQTALHMAVKGKSVDVVEELIRADHSVINLQDKKENTALHIATRKWRDQIVKELLSCPGINVNTLNKSKQTALDIAEKLPCTEHASEIKDALREAGAESARNINQPIDRRELRKSVSDIKHDMHTQLIQTVKTDKRVTGIAKELKKLHRKGLNNATNSVTVVALLIAAIAFAAIFAVPGQYMGQGPHAGEAMVVRKLAFQVFFVFDSLGLFISLAVVVVQITLVAWETKAQRKVVLVINKLMWLACVCISVSFIALAHIVVGHKARWAAFAVTAIGASFMIATLATMCYFVFRHQIRKYREHSQRKIRKSTQSRSYSWSVYSLSDSDMCKSEYEKMYAL
ncbi:hypothetical protein SUGI_1018810 [Cryptomeria japonica]|uniref:ankyrin repeat-containing protein At2g01680 n=1 Tax=Cryptomeria japonica TaxID=3369 RepID=UPI0024146E64|nr:ankyrin repeat-containing protein At2g01680 [Cryptomeria japonica]GLJ48258.1 hypothetical protein SUGI_1018810 [Cryptomeria japonica]